MGNICCRTEKKINPFSKKLIQIRPKCSVCTSKNNKDTYSNSSSDNNVLEANKTWLCIFDLEDETGYEILVNLRILRDLDGISSLNFIDSLFLSGSGIEEDSSGSFLLKIDLSLEQGKVTILVNSIYPHYYPTLLGYRKSYVLVIGGQDQLKCELYSIKSNKWKKMPELPEHRYRSCAIEDETSEFIYLFGGYNSKTKYNSTTVLKCNMKTLSQWDILLLRENAFLLERNSSAVFQMDNTNSIYILGGKDSEGTISDQIIRWDIGKQKASLSSKSLAKPASFGCQVGVDLNKAVFSFFDECNNIHQISKIDFQVSIVNFNDLFPHEEEL